MILFFSSVREYDNQEKQIGWMPSLYDPDDTYNRTVCVDYMLRIGLMSGLILLLYSLFELK